jgi:hypothetical protein
MMIGGRDTIEEFLACGIYPLSIGFDFGEVSNGTTVMSKVVVRYLLIVRNQVVCGLIYLCDE